MGIVGNSIGTLFRVTTFGESHGAALGVVIDGCPAGLELDQGGIEAELARRRPGQSKYVSPRDEPDEAQLMSGLFEGKTTGGPLMFLVLNKDVKSKDYSNLRDKFRPGHADFTYFAKYRHRDYRGGGRSSARETVGRVIAGAVAKQLLASTGISFCGGVVELGGVKVKRRVWEAAEQNEFRCVDPDMVEPMREALEAARRDRDSLGGIVEVQAHGVPAGLGEPVFGKLEAAIGGAMFSIPAVKGVEFGVGFSCVLERGSKLHDEMTPDGFQSNNHGGILGGISSGAPIVVRVAIKPTSSIPQELKTIDKDFAPTTVTTKGRHDPCVALRAVPIAEAMLALVLADYWLQDCAGREARKNFSPIELLDYRLAPGGSVGDD